MNESTVEANVQSLCDGGLLMQVTCSFFYASLLISWINGFDFMAVLIVELQLAPVGWKQPCNLCRRRSWWYKASN